MDISLRMPAGWLAATKPRTLTSAASTRPGHFENSVMSYTRMDVPSVELFETAVTFSEAHADPLSANAAFARTFGQKAGVSYLFRADSTSTGRYWVYSVDPWLEPPPEAVSAMAPKRNVIQLAPGLSYRFELDVCAGEEKVINGEKEVEPFREADEVEAWFSASAPKLGFKPDFFNVAMREMRFPYKGRTIKLPYASIEGVLQVADDEKMKKPVVRGIGSYKRVGLGLLLLTA